MSVFKKVGGQRQNVVLTHNGCQNILFIGGGNITKAIINGLMANAYDPGCIYVIDRHVEKREYFSEQYKVHVSAHINEFLNQADVVFLAVKPQGAKTTCADMKTHLSTKPLIISVMSGISLNTLNQWLGEDLAIIRTMPNTPSAIQAGATALFANANCSKEQKHQAEEILGAIGITAWVNKEADLPAITALSGSGPAYYFYFMEIMQNVAMKMGIPQEIAKSFAIQTAYGAAKLALEGNEDLAKLRSDVTSKGGTTQAGLQVLQDKNFAEILEKAMEAAKERSVELSKNFG